MGGEENSEEKGGGRKGLSSPVRGEKSLTSLLLPLAGHQCVVLGISCFSSGTRMQHPAAPAWPDLAEILLSSCHTRFLCTRGEQLSALLTAGIWGVNTTKGGQKSWRGVELSSFQYRNLRALATRKDFQRSGAKGMRCCPLWCEPRAGDSPSPWQLVLCCLTPAMLSY